VAKMLCDHLKNRQNIHSIYRKLPLILGGEQSVSTDEPVLSINKYMDEMEKDPRVLSCSWHVGYIRHDCPEAGCGIVVVPATENDIEYCEKKGDELAKYVWDKRHEFHYTGHSAYPDIALKEALAFDGKPVFITDSGDNTTAGSLGHNTYILRQFLNVEDLNKKVLIANITDRNAYNLLANYQVNDIVNIDLGMNTDENSLSVNIDVRIISFGKMMGNKWSGENRVWGNVVLVNVIDKNVDIVISTCNNSMTQINQFTKANIDINDYDIIVVKQGYLFPELKDIAAFSVMSLTKGYTIQDTRSIDYKLICRPIYPIDNI
ncbi:MAG: MlrC C-terminal domain-containing protein, partial [Erysipelotrichaceae bacterium]|nr:MlrC C-terminal domain-containing protein [Erysipelotrichaceae bacterium]